MSAGRLDLGDGWSTTANLDIVLGENGFEMGAYDVVGREKLNGRTVDGDKLDRPDGVDKIWLGNTSRVLDGSDSKDARKELGFKMDVEDIFAIIAGDIADENIKVVETADGYKIEFHNAGNDLVDTLNVNIEGFGTGVASDSKDFINDNGKATDTFVFDTDDKNDGALLGYQKNWGGSNAKSNIAYEVVSNSDDGVVYDNPDRSLKDGKYDVELVQKTALTETYTIENGGGVVDTITFVDTADGGLFDIA